MLNINWQIVINGKNRNLEGKIAQYYLTDFELSLKEKGLLSLIIYVSSRNGKVEEINMTELIIYTKEDRENILMSMQKLEDRGYLHILNEIKLEVSPFCIFESLPF